MPTQFILLLIGATVRLTRLVTVDVILERPRAWIEKRVNEKAQYLIRCPWCASWWVGLAVFVLGRFAPRRWVTIVSGALTASYVAGWAATAETIADVLIDSLASDGDDEDEEDEEDEVES